MPDSAWDVERLPRYLCLRTLGFLLLNGDTMPPSFSFHWCAGLMWTPAGLGALVSAWVACTPGWPQRQTSASRSRRP